MKMQEPPSYTGPQSNMSTETMLGEGLALEKFMKQIGVPGASAKDKEMMHKIRKNRNYASHASVACLNGYRRTQNSAERLSKLMTRQSKTTPPNRGGRVLHSIRL